MPNVSPDDREDALRMASAVLALIEDLTANQREDTVTIHAPGLYYLASLTRSEIDKYY